MIRNREICFLVRAKTKNPLNQREHWRAVSNRALVDKEETVLAAPRDTPVILPCVVVLTRYSTSKLDSHDGLRAALKHIADGVAEWVGVDDAEDDKLRFQYEQQKCKRKDEAVHVRVIQGARIRETLEFTDVAV